MKEHRGDGRPRVRLRNHGADAYRQMLGTRAYREQRAEKAEVIWRLCRNELRAARRLADLGCGTGLVKKTLETKIDKDIYGFDIDHSFMVWNQTTAVADVRRLPVCDRAFDFLLLNHVYEHVSDQPALFREAHRVLETGGKVYLSAGNVLAVIEPHYRLPFLSWLPPSLAGLYLRATGRGREYTDIRFRTHHGLVRMVGSAGFRVRDITEEALEELLTTGAAGWWRGVWGGLRRLPAGLRRWFLRALSPQWFFLLEKAGSGDEGGDNGPARLRSEEGGT